jgi:localization factor PodJL
MSISAREQSQAFDQVSQSIVSISERLERLEREQATSGVKDAVKALHQGLSRLADQIGQTANQGAAQVTAVTATMDQLAHRLGQAREDAEHGDRQLAERIAGAEHRLGEKITDADNRAGNAELRLANIEKSLQFVTNALDHTLEKLEAQANQRANDQVEAQRRTGATEESVVRLEEAVERLSHVGNDQTLSHRLDGIENSVHGMVARLESYNPAAPLEESLHNLVRRLEQLERNQSDIVSEMRANIVAAPVAPEPVFAPQAFQHNAYEPPPLAEPPVSADPDASAFLPQYGTETFSPDAFAAGQFTEASPAEDPFAPLDGMIDPAADLEEENFLAAARRSAREAAEKNTSEKKSRFRWGKSTATTEAAGKKRLLVPLLVVLAVALLAIGAAVVSQRLSQAPAPAGTPENSAPFTEVPPAGMPENSGEAQQPAQGQPQEQQPQQQGEAQPQVPAPQASAPAPAAAPSLERTAQLAESGNAVAQTIIGLRALGANGSAANPPEAFKWLSRAAEAGHAVAQYRLGTLYERGQGVAANPQTAVRWYTASANQGNRLAMYNLAVAMANRSLGQPNMPEAARWFARAAALSVGDAQFNLAVLYERGDGVPQSLVDAYKWYAIAGAAGDNGATQRAAVLATQLPEGDRAAAMKSAQGFKAQPLARAANVPPEAGDLAGQ